MLCLADVGGTKCRPLQQRVRLLYFMPLFLVRCCSEVAGRKGCLCVLQMLQKSEIHLEVLVLSLWGGGKPFFSLRKSSAGKISHVGRETLTERQGPSLFP